MDRPVSLSHTTWVCKYHVVFIPKCRRRTLYAQLRRHLGEVFHNLARQKESTIEEGHLLPDHVHIALLYRLWNYQIYHSEITEIGFSN
jgi:putative transposase